MGGVSCWCVDTDIAFSIGQERNKPMEKRRYISFKINTGVEINTGGVEFYWKGRFFVDFMRCVAAAWEWFQTAIIRGQDVMMRTFFVFAPSLGRAIDILNKVAIVVALWLGFCRFSIALDGCMGLGLNVEFQVMLAGFLLMQCVKELKVFK